jgi:CRP-like cAMP-binding protein
MTDSLTPDEKKTLIKNQKIFSQLTDDELDVLMTLFTEVHVKAGNIIVTEGDPVDSVFIIVSGKADVRRSTVENNQIKTTSLAILKRGEAIGLNETGFYSLSGVRTATVAAITDMVLLRLSVASFHGFALSNSHVGSILRKNSEGMER